MYISKEMLKAPKIRLEKSEVCQKVIFDKNGKIKDVTTIMDKLQKIFKERQNEYDSDYYNRNYMHNDSIYK